MAKNLIIVESPAKCKTIQKFLGKDYALTASYGHIRDLPDRKLGVDVKKNYEPTYQNLKDKQKVIKEISSLAKKSESIFIATDPDREGEAIAWHIFHAAKLAKTKTHRIVFNEISEKAIKYAIENQRELDMNLVDAQQARRILDRLIGYKLSPILSKKIKRGLSAGRVQSVAVRIVCDREREIQAFEPQEYWNIDVSLAEPSKSDEITCRLFAKQSPKEKFEINNEADAQAVVTSLEKAAYSVHDIKKSRVQRHPAAPFITSTLQQEASRKCNWSAKKTMMVAQQLYEGVTIDGDSVGLITYMRTDSTRISDDATTGFSNFVKKKYGDHYLRKVAKKSAAKKNIQDAHEAIRPVYVHYPPDKIEQQLKPDHYKLYKLIWDRVVSSLMASAQIDRTQIQVSAQSANDTYFLRTTGSVMVFDGFTKVYLEGKDTQGDEDDKNKILPPLEKETPLTKKQIEKEQKFTQPPSRYTEASLVKELEEQGIGRPSTYAPTMSVIQDRGYILKEQKKLYPSDLGFVVNDQMSEYFNTVVDLSFTASMEKQLDEVSDGKHEWQKVVDSYYKPLDNMIQNAYTNMEKVNFGERVLGTDPESGKEVLAREGRFGPMIQIGRGSESEEKPRFAGLLPDQDIETITLEDALKLFQLPRTIGTFENVELLVNSGRYGPYIKFDSQFVSIPREINPLEISLEQAVELIKEKRKKDAEKYIHVFDEHDPPVMVLNGRYGPYITSAKKNYKIPKDIDPKTLDLAQCLDIINAIPKRKK